MLRFIWDMIVTTLFSVICIVFVGVASYYISMAETIMRDSFYNNIKNATDAGNRELQDYIQRGLDNKTVSMD